MFHGLILPSWSALHQRKRDAEICGSSASPSETARRRDDASQLEDTSVSGKHTPLWWSYPACQTKEGRRRTSAPLPLDQSKTSDCIASRSANRSKPAAKARS